MSCQATFEDIESETKAQHGTDKDQTLDTTQNDKTPVQSQSSHSDTLRNHLPIKPTPTTAIGSTQPSVTLQIVTSSKSLPTLSKQSEVAVSSVTSVGKTPPVIYRTLKSPVTSGAPLLPQRVALKSSPPSLPVQQSMSSVKSSSAPVSSVVSPSDVRYVSVCIQLCQNVLTGGNFAAFTQLLVAHSTLNFTRSPLAGKGTWCLLPTTPK